METFSQRESILLGYTPQRTCTDNHPISSSSNSPDIDFNDVFGGPPRRSSAQETRYSFAESDADSYGLTSTSNHRHTWSALSEKPVFGDESANRQRYPSHDFFDDIFRGNESSSFSSRKNDLDSFSLNPGSRALSPVRPSPPRAAEPFASSSLPAQFSLPAQMNKGTDLPTFASSSRNHHKMKDTTSNDFSFYVQSPLSRFSNQVQEESRIDACVESSLSTELFVGGLESSGLTKPDEMDKGSNLKKDSNTPEAKSNSKHFHFSIYKWASKGVPIALPLRGGNSSKSKERMKFERSSSASRIACEGMAKDLPIITSQDTENALFSNSISSDTRSFEIELDNKENDSLCGTGTTTGRVEQGRSVREAVIPKFEPQNQIAYQENLQDIPGNIIFQDSGDRKTVSVADTHVEETIPVVKNENPKAESKTLRSLISGTDEITIKKESKEINVNGVKKSTALLNISEKVKKQDEKISTLNSKETDKKDKSPGSARNSQDGLTKNRARGKVKEFVKIFNHESSNKPTRTVDAQNLSSRWKEKGKFMAEDIPTVKTPKEDEEVHLSNGNKNRKPDASFIREDEVLKQFDKQHSEPAYFSSGLKDRTSSSTASIPDGPEAIVGDSDDYFHGNILIEELPQDEDELLQAVRDQEDFQVIDAKIRKWSNGKEGNIRSLLSTLQYVLWPESGWKVVPLVDIIEGNAVKRSYQKALLSLHPDKLQQKGATSQQKYMAERVFDILQEAWTHFNSLGSV